MKFKFTALEAIYAADVLDGNRTIEEVPLMIRDDVQGMLATSKNSGSTDTSTTPQA